MCRQTDLHEGMNMGSYPGHIGLYTITHTRMSYQNT